MPILLTVQRNCAWLAGSDGSATGRPRRQPDRDGRIDRIVARVALGRRLEVQPAGGVDEYVEKFFRPYRAYPQPIYAVPGNHDWYDDCTGFMFWFCGAEQIPKWKRGGVSPGALMRRLLWRHPPRPHRRRVDKARA